VSLPSPRALDALKPFSYVALLTASFQGHNRAGQGSIFLHTHLWMHTILASRYLTDPTVVRKKHTSGTISGHTTPHTMTVNNLWRNSARTIGDILVLSDIINPFTYIALPFVNQAFYVAGSCYVKGKSSSVLK
jgi:hypothetical protein